MPRDVICPSCGFRNPPGLDACSACNYPFTSLTLAGDATEEMSRTESSSAGIPTYAPRRTLRRPPRSAAPVSGQAMWLWLLFGAFAVVMIFFTAVQGFRKQNVVPPVAGATPDQQKMVDAARSDIAKDSTNIEAHLALANVLYDTGNWPEAVVHYKTVLRHDPTRVPPMVDLGVCYYNLGETDQAMALFESAVKLDPHQPIALFNLGIVSERRGDAHAALDFYHRALESAPSEELKKAIATAVERTSQQAGKSPPPASNGTPSGK